MERGGGEGPTGLRGSEQSSQGSNTQRAKAEAENETPFTRSLHQQTHHTEETHSLACGFPATPAMACWPICICPMAPMPPTGAPAGRGPMPMAPGPPPTPVRLVRAFMASSRRVDNRQHYAAPTCTVETTTAMSPVQRGPAEDRTQQRNPNGDRKSTYLDLRGSSYLQETQSSMT